MCESILDHHWLKSKDNGICLFGTDPLEQLILNISLPCITSIIENRPLYIHFVAFAFVTYIHVSIAMYYIHHWTQVAIHPYLGIRVCFAWVSTCYECVSDYRRTYVRSHVIPAVVLHKITTVVYVSRTYIEIKSEYIPGHEKLLMYWHTRPRDTSFVTSQEMSRSLKSPTSWLFDEKLIVINKQWKPLGYTLLALCQGNPPILGGFASQRASNTKIVSISWRHHVTGVITFFTTASCNNHWRA